MSCFGSEYKMNEHFTRFTRKKKSKLFAKNVAKTARRQLNGRHKILQIFTKVNNPLSPKLADKHALSKMNLTSMEVSLF